MEDGQIVELYWSRSERAISETAAKYGSYCFSIARNILENREDSEECVNDTYMAAWNAMPPHRPVLLSTFLGKLTRRISINRWKAQHRDKRGSGEISLALEELAECVPAPEDTEAAVETGELLRAVNGFLSTLPEAERDVFVSRYWFMAPLAQISRRSRFSQSKIKSMLFRTRGKLREHLRREGLI